MNCQDCKQHLLEFEYGELSHNLREEILAELESCPDCKRELESLREVRSAFQDALPSVEPPALLHANIVREARRAAYAETDARSMWDRLRSLLFHPTFAVAAALVLIIGVAMFTFDEGPGDSGLLVSETMTAAKSNIPSAEPAAAPTEVASVEVADDEAPSKSEAEDSLDGKEVAAADTEKTWPVRLADEPKPAPARRGAAATAPQMEAKKDETVSAKTAGSRVALAKGTSNKSAANVGRAESYANRYDTRNRAKSALAGGGKAKANQAAFPFEGQTAAEPVVAQTNDNKEQSSPKDEYDRGFALYSGGRYSDAIKRFDRTVSTAPKSSNYYGMALFYRGKAQLQEGRAAEAVASFRKVLSEKVAGVDRQKVEYNLATALLRVNPKDTEAEAILAKLMKGGGGGVSTDAATAYSRSFGAKDKKASKAKRPANKPARRMMKKSKSFDSNQELDVPASNRSVY